MPSQPSSLAEKLHLEPGRIGRVTHPPEGLDPTLGLPEESFVGSGPDPDVVVAFRREPGVAEDIVPRAATTLRKGGVFRLCTPKGGPPGAGRDMGGGPVEALGFRGGTEADIDGAWSATRFRPREEVPGGTE